MSLLECPQGISGGGPYLHYSDLLGDSLAERDRKWAGIKLGRVATRQEIRILGTLCVCRPKRLEDLVLEVMAPPGPDLSPFSGVSVQADRAEADVADALALCRLCGVHVDPVSGANLLRTRGEPRSGMERELVSTYRDLSIPCRGLSLIRRVAAEAGLHGVVAGGLVAGAHWREDRRQALLDWRGGIRDAGVPGIEQVAILEPLTAEGLVRAAEFMQSDEGDATYPVLELVAALSEARRGGQAAGQARAERLSAGTGPDLNDRQALVLDQVGETPGFATTLAHHKATFGVVYETARTDLLGLVRQGRLTQSRVGRAFVFTAGSGVPAPVPLPPPARSPRATPRPASPPDSLPVFF